MSCQKLSRQSLHLVLKEGSGLYSLRHMDVSKLFYASTAEAEAKASKKRKGIYNLGSISCLPRPSIHYQPFVPALCNPNNLVDMFTAFGESKNKILYSDMKGCTNMYNTEFHSFMTMPHMNSPKGPNCMVAHITRTAAHARSDFVIDPEMDYNIYNQHPHGEHTDSLYVMGMGRDRKGCFEVLAHYPLLEWQWRLLPLPPFFDDLEYKACDNIAYAVVDGTRICVSSATATYCFDTVDREWSKTGDWVLPFHTKAEYVPELNLWLGMSASSPSDLCALDLSAAVMNSCGVLPMVQHVGLDVDLPEDYSLKSRTLVNLGSGRFCIATFFHTADAPDGPLVASFTGVDVVPCDDKQQGERALRSVKHKSKCLLADRIKYVL